MNDDISIDFDIDASDNQRDQAQLETVSLFFNTLFKVKVKMFFIQSQKIKIDEAALVFVKILYTTK